MDAANEQVWRDYAERKLNERLAESEHVWARLATAGANEETVLAVDFVAFGPTSAHAEALRDRLAGHYAITLEPGPDGYVLVKGTTRPYGITLTEPLHRDWVRFMCEASPSLGVVANSEDVEAGG
jgi:hypothetical protein